MATGKLRNINGYEYFAERLQNYAISLLNIPEGQEKPQICSELSPEICGTLNVC